MLNSILFSIKFSSSHVLQQVQQEYGKRSEGRLGTTPRNMPTWLISREGGSMRILQEANSLLVALDMGQTNGG